MASIIKVDTIQEKTTGNGVVFSNPVELANGTAAAPSLAFTSDPDTGLYRISEDKIGVAVGGSRVGEVGAGYGGFTGNVIQVTTNTYSTQVSTTNNTYRSVGFSCSITPKYTSSKILVMYMIGGCYANLSNGYRFKLYRNGSDIGSLEDAHAMGYYPAGGSYLWTGAKYSGHILDSPNSISSQSYEIYFHSRDNTGTVYVQHTSSVSSIVLLEVQQ